MIQEAIEQNILESLPYRTPFRFLDEITELDEDHICGSYRYRPDEFFYAGHFPGNPVTPGVVLTETMAQIGLVAFGIYLYGATPEIMKSLQVFFTSSEVNFYRLVRPGDKVIVRSQKLFFRLRKLKCEVRMETESGELISKGTLSGMFVKTDG